MDPFGKIRFCAPPIPNPLISQCYLFYMYNNQCNTIKVRSHSVNATANAKVVLQTVSFQMGRVANQFLAMLLTILTANITENLHFRFRNHSV